MIRITDKSFRYTASYNTDLKKTFRKMEQAARAAAASSKLSEAADHVVPIMGRRTVAKSLPAGSRSGADDRKVRASPRCPSPSN